MCSPERCIPFWVKTVNASEVTGEELAAKMIRRELKAPQYPKVEETGEDVIVLDHVSYHKESKHNGLNDVSLRIRRGGGGRDRRRGRKRTAGFPTAFWSCLKERLWVNTRAKIRL